MERMRVSAISTGSSDEARVGLARGQAAPAGQEYEPERVRRLVAEALTAAGLADGGVPFAGLIEPGMTVLLKPNWVYHLNRAPSGAGNACLYTQHAFILAVLEAVVARRPARVVIGDAPIQACVFDQLATPEFRAAAAAVAGDVPLTITDFRLVRTVSDRLEDGRVETDRRPEDCVLFDLGVESRLEPITSPDSQFRVSAYDPRVLQRAHQPGKHQYLVAREAVDADVIVGLPKLKTHKKAGLTGALKNWVGIIASKDYLTHHRVGGSGAGGDCYAGRDPIRRLAEALADQANQRVGSRSFGFYWMSAHALLRLKRLLGLPADIDGSWHGNDTCWRMALDLNRIVHYGRPDGTLAETPQRQVLSLVDGIVAGQGDGPILPDALPLDIVVAARNVAYADWVGALLLGLDPRALAIVTHAFDRGPHPLTAAGPEALTVWADGRAVDEATLLAEYAQPAVPPAGWQGECEHPQRARRAEPVGQS